MKCNTGLNWVEAKQKKQKKQKTTTKKKMNPAISSIKNYSEKS